MPLQELIATISADAQVQAQAIGQNAQQELAFIKEQTAVLIAMKRRELLAATQAKEEDIRQRMEARRQLAATQSILAQKQELLESCFIQAKKNLEQLSGVERKKLLTKLLTKAQREVKITEVIAAKSDAGFFGKKYKMTTGDGIGGFVAIGEGATIRVDYRFERILEQVRARKSAEIAQVLFQIEPVTPVKAIKVVQKVEKQVPMVQTKIKSKPVLKPAPIVQSKSSNELIKKPNVVQKQGSIMQNEVKTNIVK